jgi:outer membrane protein OmpA-like peptidoglycan-associated protein
MAMKRSLLASVFILILGLSGQGAAAKSPEFSVFAKNEFPHYVVVGAFTYHRNAVRFVEFTKKHNYPAYYAFNPVRKLYYVLVYSSWNRDEAVTEVLKMRQNEVYHDAWVYTGPLNDVDTSGKPLAATGGIVDKISGGANAENKPKVPVSPKIDNEKVKIRVVEQVPVFEASEGREDSKPVVSIPGRTHLEEPTSDETLPKEEKAPTAAAPQEQAPPRPEGTYRIFLNTYNSRNFKEVKGKAKLIDAVRGRQLETFESHKLRDIRDPNNGSSTVKVATEIFGFRELQQTINLKEPLNDSTRHFIEITGDTIMLNYELKRYNKGDLMVMYNVYFYKDAAIMRPESVYELNQLLDMVKENDKLKIRIHGHTNGNASGKIIHLDKEDKNFFTLNTDTHKVTNGSAKELSFQRSYTIQHWLMEQGVAEGRMEIKGWGGKKMIYGKHDAQADKNVRVEIEIIED